MGASLASDPTLLLLVLLVVVVVAGRRLVVVVVFDCCSEWWPVQSVDPGRDETVSMVVVVRIMTKDLLLRLLP